MVGAATRNDPETDPTVAGPSTRRSRICRRIGWASAWKQPSRAADRRLATWLSMLCWHLAFWLSSSSPLTFAWLRFYRRLSDEWLRWRAWIDRLEARERELFGEGPG